MGGKKKLGLKQMERQQVKVDDEKSKDKKKEKAGRDVPTSPDKAGPNGVREVEVKQSA